TVTGLLPRFYDVADGRVTIDGVDVRTVTLDSLRRQVGVVFEDAFLFSDTVHANIAYRAPDATRDAVRAAADAAGATRFVDELPDGLDTVVGERGLTLSGGQRQRIALARAILSHPRGRSTAAKRAGAGHPQRPARASARRRHVGGRRGHGGGDPRDPARAHG